MSRIAIIPARPKHAFIEGAFARARDASVLAAERLDASGQARAAMMARFLEINALARQGHFEEAGAAAARLRPAMDASEDLPMRAEFHRIASSAVAETWHEPALQDARLSLSLALRIGDRYAEARARHNVAAIAGKFRLYDEAIEENERATAAYREVGAADGARDTTLNVVAVTLFCGDFERAERLLDRLETEEPNENAWVQLRVALLWGALDARLGRATAERWLRDARARAETLGADLYGVRADIELGEMLARGNRLDDASACLRRATDSVTALVGSTTTAATAYALSARLHATCGRLEEAREHAALAMHAARGLRVQSHSEIAWNAAAAFAMAGDGDAAMALARDAAAAAIDDTMHMPAELAECYLRLPVHREAFAYLWERPVALALNG